VIGHFELVAIHFFNDCLCSLKVACLPFNLGRAAAVAALEVDGEVEGGHLSVFVCCVYPSRSAAQSRSLMCQVVDWHSGAGKGKGRPSANALRLAADRAIMVLCC